MGHGQRGLGVGLQSQVPVLGSARPRGHSLRVPRGRLLPSLPSVLDPRALPLSRSPLLLGFLGSLHTQTCNDSHAQGRLPARPGKDASPAA